MKTQKLQIKIVPLFDLCVYPVVILEERGEVEKKRYQGGWPLAMAK